ncbi:MAG: SMI1/KNR4 family protein [Planctomycetes bacterium]|nr:SMI1/KNR4 family protein [Planctomycetota bacterium]
MKHSLLPGIVLACLVSGTQEAKGPDPVRLHGVTTRDGTFELTFHTPYPKGAALDVILERVVCYMTWSPWLEPMPGGSPIELVNMTIRKDIQPVPPGDAYAPRSLVGKDGVFTPALKTAEAFFQALRSAIARARATIQSGREAPMPTSIDAVIDRMMSLGWKPGIPASEQQVRRLEQKVGAALPTDYRSFLLIAGGGDPQASEAWRGLWRIGDLWTWNCRYHIPDNFPGLLAIGNEGFMVYALDLRRPESRPVVSLGLSSSVWDDVLQEASSFVEWMDRAIPA